jgi:hypothetical protein
MAFVHQFEHVDKARYQQTLKTYHLNENVTIVVVHME